jgi:uncharacterized membrane protein YeaQ/YmgE (transglycosylase-associated protein family)
MGIFVWFVIGALTGLFVARLMPGRFPGDRSGAAASGAMGGFLAGALFASVIAEEPGQIAASTLPVAGLGAALFTFLIGRLPPTQRRREEGGSHPP